MADPVAQAALDRALEDDDNLVLFYQPIHDARTRAIVAAEALLRQRRESGEIREASKIAQAAENSSAPELFAFDSVVIRRAYADAARWQADGAHVRLNVNLSPREFQEGHVLDRLTGLVTSCGVDVRQVNLEITETSYIEHPRETMGVLEELKTLGVELWLDDFGTGHSSITHLQHFPLDGIKLPATFVEHVPRDRRCVAITRGVIGIAHELGLKVIAEGVESQEQLEFLLDQRCEYVQGFLFSKPMTLDDFLVLLSDPPRAASPA